MLSHQPDFDSLPSPRAARQREIDAGNARMLKNLVAIQAGGASFDVGKQQQPHGGGGSLSRTAKKTEQARVDAENTRLLDRIIADHGASPPERKERWLSRCGGGGEAFTFGASVD